MSKVGNETKANVKGAMKNGLPSGCANLPGKSGSAGPGKETGGAAALKAAQGPEKFTKLGGLKA